ncbi:MAG: methylated-DNA--[protein]-cysteine S-methyltransferase [Clostridia bacterium]|nr:methylated-DNA--[protein]-cysteine S-methyltransferase [Clostridia bacterium]
MSDDNAYLRKVRLTDASLLRRNGLFDGKISEIEDKIKNISESSFVDMYIFKRNSNADLCSAIYLYRRDDKMFSGDLKIYISCLVDENMYLREYRTILESTLDVAFREGFYKISIKLRSDEIDKENVLKEFDFVQEAILHEEYGFDEDVSEAGLFYLIEPRYKKYNCCFVPFPKGVYVLYGGRDYVDCGRIYPYSSEIKDSKALKMGKYLGIIDKDNRLALKGNSNYFFDEELLERILPDEVFKGYIELKQYFQKERSSFDLKIKFESKSDFRLNVWNEIRKISYASTLCYEDVALSLCSNDAAKAKNMVRVVGQACADCPVPIVIPCHRVIGKDGRLVGYKEGIEFKDFLLIHESFSAIII